MREPWKVNMESTMLAIPASRGIDIECPHQVIARTKTSDYVSPEVERIAAHLIAAAPTMLDALEIILFAVTTDADANDGRIDRVAVKMLCEAAIKTTKGD